MSRTRPVHERWNKRVSRSGTVKTNMEQAANKNLGKGTTPPVAHQQAAREMSDKLGPAGAARDLGLDPSTFARVVAGMGVRRGTLAILAQRFGAAA
jgi:hypothetical protein